MFRPTFSFWKLFPLRHRWFRISLILERISEFSKRHRWAIVPSLKLNFFLHILIVDCLRLLPYDSLLDILLQDISLEILQLVFIEYFLIVNYISHRMIAISRNTWDFLPLFWMSYQSQRLLIRHILATGLYLRWLSLLGAGPRLHNLRQNLIVSQLFIFALDIFIQKIGEEVV